MKIGVLGILFGLMFLPVMSVSAQSCNRGVVVRDEQGRVLRAEELKSIHQQLPKTIGNADTAVDDSQTF